MARANAITGECSTMTSKVYSGVSYLPGQLEIAGTARNYRDIVQAKATAPLLPMKEQKPCDVGLFSDEANQLDLIEMFMD